MSVQGDVNASDGRTVRFYDTGAVPDAGPTVFWHHGTPQTGRLLDPIVEAAARRGMRVVSCARAGYEGTSEIPGRTVAAAAADVIRVADELGIARFATMGASGGGPHALAAAALAPDRIVGVVTLAGIAPFTTDFDWFAGMASPGGLSSGLEGRAARAAYAEIAEFDETSFTEADFRMLAGPWSVLGADAQRASGAGAAGRSTTMSPSRSRGDSSSATF
ncbi:alpha/beta fold hydrolase [Leifsonia poae]|uniref:alpha/beta fold hydrolase n=1 Tax=Leifsonia poae TaxID=110933 RepID=UPI003D666739